MQRDTKKNYQLYGRNDMIMLDEHNKIYGSLGLAEPYIIATKEGETLLLDGAKDNEPFVGLSIYGKSHQNTVAGNQLFDFANSFESYEGDGLVVKNNGDGSFDVIGKTPGYLNIKTVVTELSPGSYYMNNNSKNKQSSFVFQVIAYKGEERNFYYDQSFEVDGTETSIEINARFSGAINDVNDTVFPMLNAGTTALPWEPYTGGQPSPNPDYPQEIVSVGDDGEIGVDVYGGNLLDIGILTDLAGTTVKYFPVGVGSGSFTLSSNTPTENGIYNLFFFAGNVLMGANSRSNGVGNGMDRTVTSVDGYVTVGARSFSENPNNPLDYDIMLNAGTTALPFEPYKQPQSLIVSTPNGLPGIPVSSGGNYTDENGQQWISDEVDYRRGKYVQRTELLRITDFSEISNPMHTDLGNTECNIQILGHYPDVQNMSHVDRSMCDSFIYSAIGDYERFAIGSDTELRVYFTLNGVLSREEFIAKMEEISPTILFPLATPIETNLTPEQITAYQSLHTNYPTTTVMNDSDAGMKAIYKQIENGG